MLLAGDVGGTKVALALFEEAGGRLVLQDQQSYPSADYDSVESAVSGS